MGSSMRLQKPERRCFVTLPDGSQKDFPTATNIRDEDSESFSIWNDRVFLARYSAGEHRGVWFNPQFLINQKKEQARRNRIGRH